MSQLNVEICKRANTLFNGGDRDGALDHFHPDVEWRDLDHAPDALESVRGVAAVRAIWDQWDVAFDEFTAETEEYIGVGDCVVCVTHWRATGRASAVAVDLHRAEIYEFDDGKVVRATVGYPDKAAALAAVGVRG